MLARSAQAQHFQSCVLDLSAGLVVGHRLKKQFHNLRKNSLSYLLRHRDGVCPLGELVLQYKEVVVVVW